MMNAPPQPVQRFDDAWRGWIAENLASGQTPEALVRILIDNRFPPEDARSEVTAASDSPYLHAARRLFSRVAKRDWTLDVQRKTRRLRHAEQAGIPCGFAAARLTRRTSFDLWL